MVLSDFAAEGVAVNSEHFGSAALVSLSMIEDALDEFFLEFRKRFFEKNSAIDHHSHQRFQLLFHVCTLRSNARKRESPSSVECVAGDALIGFPVLIPRARDDVRRKRRGRRLFVPADALQIIADVLLIK